MNEGGFKLNKVEDTLAHIKNSMEYHRHEKTVLEKAKEDIKIRVYGDLYDTLVECLEFKISFHEYQIAGLNEIRDEIMEKYHVG